MIYVNRGSVAIPSALNFSKVMNAAAEIAEVVTAGDKRRRPTILRALFENEEVAHALTVLFSGKCAYCESPVAERDSVDHFRPLSSAEMERKPSSLFHYSWLAYEWENLLLACASCRSSKGNIFPVSGKRAAALMPLAEIRRVESSQLIDPAWDDPGHHLRFEASGHCVGRTAAGRTTIKVLDLNRQGLVESRRAAVSETADCLQSIASGSVSAVRMLEQQLLQSSSFLAARRSFANAVAYRLSAQLNRARPSARRVASALPELVVASGPDRTVQALTAAFQVRLERQELPAAIRSTPLRTQLRSPPPIARIVIENFKAIEHLSIDLADRVHSTGDASCLMLLGENATGKSTVLEAVALALVGPAEANQLPLAPSDFLRRRRPDKWQMGKAEKAYVRVDFHDKRRPAEVWIEPGSNAFGGSTPAEFIARGYGARRYFDRSRVRGSVGRGGRVRGMFDPFHVLPHPSYWLENLSPHRFEAVARGLREILVLRDDDDLVLDDELGICVVANGMTTPIDRLSDGYKSIFATAVDIIRSLLSRSDNLESARAVVLIDEIETHLHPQWKMRVVSALRRAMPRVQFIATTHDPLCLRGMNDGEVAVLVRSEAAIEVLSDLPDVRGMRVDQLLTSDYFGLNSTADPDVELELAKLADRASTFDLVESDPTQLSLANSIVLGEGPEDQIAAEALQQYLNLRRSSSSAGRTDARKRAVDAFLAAIGRRTGG